MGSERERNRWTHNRGQQFPAAQKFFAKIVNQTAQSPAERFENERIAGIGPRLR
jgi:hypothetical protein